MKKVVIIAMALLICQAGWAQNEKIDAKIDKRMEEMDAQLGLTAEQEVQIRAILVESWQQITALKAQGDADQEAIRIVRKELRSSIKALLTVEQAAQLQEDQRNQPKLSKEARQAKAKARKEGMIKNRPLLKTERTSFESQLTLEEKDMVAKARAFIAANKELMGDSSRKNLSVDQKQLIKANRDSASNLLLPVVANHKEELMAVEAKVKSARQPAKEAEGAIRKQRVNDHKEKPSERFYQRFLLMKP